VYNDYVENLYFEQGEFMQKELPVRKKIRLEGYDYSSNGAYFLTFCTKDGHSMLGEIVGRGILDAPSVQLSEYGKNIIDTFEFFNNRNDKITIDKYVVMPNHVHVIVFINDLDSGVRDLGNGASGKPRPTNALIPKFMSSVKRYTNK
jgi:REP element-mobilizing transposase RayT